MVVLHPRIGALLVNFLSAVVVREQFQRGITLQPGFEFHLFSKDGLVKWNAVGVMCKAAVFKNCAFVAEDADFPCCSWGDGQVDEGECECDVETRGIDGVDRIDEHL